jgi:hypothetical protein
MKLNTFPAVGGFQKLRWMILMAKLVLLHLFFIEAERSETKVSLDGVWRFSYESRAADYAHFPAPDKLEHIPMRSDDRFSL